MDNSIETGSTCNYYVTSMCGDPEVIALVQAWKSNPVPDKEIFNQNFGTFYKVTYTDSVTDIMKQDRFNRYYRALTEEELNFVRHNDNIYVGDVSGSGDVDAIMFISLAKQDLGLVFYLTYSDGSRDFMSRNMLENIYRPLTEDELNFLRKN